MFTQSMSKVYDTLIHWHDFRIKLCGEGIIVGFFVGIIIVLFRYLLEQAETLRTLVYQYLRSGYWPFTILWFLGLFIIAYLLRWIITIEPMSAGSGIPQVKGIILGFMKMSWLKVLITKFIGGVLAIGAGLSLGREGPSVQLGATIGQGFSRLLGRTKLEERYLLTSGASAGLAAAFNAPLAGVIFSFEELHKNFSSTILISAIAATLTADVVTQYFFGYNPIFSFSDLPIFPIRNYGLIILLGIIVGILGVTFNRVLLKTLDLYEQQNLLTGIGKIAFPLVVAGIIGFFLPEILGGGNNLVNALSSRNFSLILLCILLTGKFFFTMLSYGAGVPGGIFLPMLVIGALAGSIMSHIFVLTGQLDSYYSNNIIILSMAACFSAVVKTPLTGSVLIMEMTGSFNHMLSLIIVSMTAYLFADIVKSKPIYETLLERSMIKQKKLPKSSTENKRMVMELAVSMGSELADKQIKNINWPPNCLLVSIKRGNIELIPQGDTLIIANDYLYLLTNVEQTKQLRELATECILKIS